MKAATVQHEAVGSFFANYNLLSLMYGVYLDRVEDIVALSLCSRTLYRASNRIPELRLFRWTFASLDPSFDFSWYGVMRDLAFQCDSIHVRPLYFGWALDKAEDFVDDWNITRPFKDAIKYIVQCDRVDLLELIDMRVPRDCKSGMFDFWTRVCVASIRCRAPRIYDIAVTRFCQEAWMHHPVCSSIERCHAKRVETLVRNGYPYEGVYTGMKMNVPLPGDENYAGEMLAESRNQWMFNNGFVHMTMCGDTDTFDAEVARYIPPTPNQDLNWAFFYDMILEILQYHAFAVSVTMFAHIYTVYFEQQLLKFANDQDRRDCDADHYREFIRVCDFFVDDEWDFPVDSARNCHALLHWAAENLRYCIAFQGGREGRKNLGPSPAVRLKMRRVDAHMQFIEERARRKALRCYDMAGTRASFYASDAPLSLYDATLEERSRYLTWNDYLYERRRQERREREEQKRREQAERLEAKRRNRKRQRDKVKKEDDDDEESNKGDADNE